jgi:hypothetical protein
MNPEAVARYQKDALTGHRPTWKMGANTSAKRGKGSAEADLEGAFDPFSMFSELNGRGRWRPGSGSGAETKVETRKVFNAERKALQVMGLGADATLETVKAKYKALVKQHHPDANGGDRSTEDWIVLDSHFRAGAKPDQVPSQVSLRTRSTAGSTAPLPRLRRITQVTIATISAPLITASNQHSLASPA